MWMLEFHLGRLGIAIVLLGGVAQRRSVFVVDQVEVSAKEVVLPVDCRLERELAVVSRSVPV